jgi:hypothetical protein
MENLIWARWSYETKRETVINQLDFLPLPASPKGHTLILNLLEPTPEEVSRLKFHRKDPSAAANKGFHAKAFSPIPEITITEITEQG